MKVSSAPLAAALFGACALVALSPAIAATQTAKSAPVNSKSSAATVAQNQKGRASVNAASSTTASQSRAIGQNIAANLGPITAHVDPALMESALRAQIGGKDPAIAPERAEKVLDAASKLSPGASLPAGISTADVTNALAGYFVGPSLNAIKDDLDLPALFGALQATLKAKGKGAMDDASLRRELQAFSTRYQQAASARRAKLAESNKSEGAAFLARNKTANGVMTTASGLQYTVVRQGDGLRPSAAQKVRVHYEGRLLDGTVFDSSYKRNEPTEFGLNQVIKGWTEGVALMPVGSKYRFFIPGELAYGASPRPGGVIGPNAVLVFDVELLAIVPN